MLSADITTRVIQAKAAYRNHFFSTYRTTKTFSGLSLRLLTKFLAFNLCLLLAQSNHIKSLIFWPSQQVCLIGFSYLDIYWSREIEKKRRSDFLRMIAFKLCAEKAFCRYPDSTWIFRGRRSDTARYRNPMTPILFWRRQFLRQVFHLSRATADSEQLPANKGTWPSHLATVRASAIANEFWRLRRNRRRLFHSCLSSFFCWTRL